MGTTGNIILAVVLLPFAAFWVVKFGTFGYLVARQKFEDLKKKEKPSNGDTR